MKIFNSKYYKLTTVLSKLPWCKFTPLLPLIWLFVIKVPNPYVKGDESDEDDEDEERREPLGGASRIAIRKWKKVKRKSVLYQGLA